MTLTSVAYVRLYIDMPGPSRMVSITVGNPPVEVDDVQQRVVRSIARLVAVWSEHHKHGDFCRQTPHSELLRVFLPAC